MSLGSAGRAPKHPRELWASVLFTRLTVMAHSISRLAPRTGPAADRNAHWDYSSTASLVRNLAECYFVFFHLCVEPVSEDEWAMRIALLQLRDNDGRRRMFAEWDGGDPQLLAFEQLHQQLLERIKANDSFLALSAARQRNLLNPRNAAFTQDEVLDRMGDDPSYFRGMYRFFCAHVHSAPMAYMRMIENDHGRGSESRVDREYMAIALTMAAQFIERATADMLRIFPDAENSGQAQRGRDHRSRRPRHLRKQGRR